jgi:hypothetical protein
MLYAAVVELATGVFAALLAPAACVVTLILRT